MQISEINILTPIEVVIEDGDAKETILVFYENTSKSFHCLSPLDENKLSLIRNGIKDYFEEESDLIDFSMPVHVLETVSRAEDEDHEYFGLTKDMKEFNNQEEDNKEGTDV